MRRALILRVTREGKVTWPQVIIVRTGKCLDGPWIEWANRKHDDITIGKHPLNYWSLWGESIGHRFIPSQGTMQWCRAFNLLWVSVSCWRNNWVADHWIYHDASVMSICNLAPPLSFRWRHHWVVLSVYEMFCVNLFMWPVFALAS